MNKGERISRFVEERQGGPILQAGSDISRHPCYLLFFECWNDQRYYEAHDVLEHLWLSTETDDAGYFKGLIQAAGAFVHLQKQFERPWHVKDGRRLHPAVRLFDLARRNLNPHLPLRHRFNLRDFDRLLARFRDEIVAHNYSLNPWSPMSAPVLRFCSD